MILSESFSNKPFAQLATAHIFTDYVKHEKSMPRTRLSFAKLDESVSFDDWDYWAGVCFMDDVLARPVVQVGWDYGVYL